MAEKAFDADLVQADLQAESLPAALTALLQEMVDQRDLPSESLPAVREALLRREAVGSTALGNGVALPHAPAAGVRKALLAVARVRPPGLPPGPDGKPVRLLFCMVTPGGGPGDEDLVRLQRISRAARDASWVDSCLRAPGPEGLLQHLKSGARRRRDDV